MVLAPRDTVTIRFAILWARGEDHLDSVTVLKKDARAIRSISESLYQPTLISSSVPDAAPNYLRFDQNYPNPFSESTTIRYSLPQSMRVRLAVFDALGREVSLLVNQQQPAGDYAINFEAGNLPVGIYLARIELDHLRFTKQMVLMR